MCRARRPSGAGQTASVELVTVEGARLVERLDRTKAVQALRFRTAGSLQSVRLDPDGIYPDLTPEDNVWPRK